MHTNTLGKIFFLIGLLFLVWALLTPSSSPQFGSAGRRYFILFGVGLALESLDQAISMPETLGTLCVFTGAMLILAGVLPVLWKRTRKPS